MNEYIVLVGRSPLEKQGNYQRYQVVASNLRIAMIQALEAYKPRGLRKGRGVIYYMAVLNEGPAGG